MGNAAPPTKIRQITRIIVFTASLVVFLGWLAAPEALRSGRNAAFRYLLLPPEPAAAVNPPIPASTTPPEGNPSALGFSALILLALGFGRPEAWLARTRHLVRGVSRGASTFLVRLVPGADSAMLGPSLALRYRGSTAFLLSLGLLLGWMSAPRFVRDQGASVAALRVQGDEQGSLSGSGKSSGLLDGFASWMGPGSIGRVLDQVVAPELVLGSAPQAVELLDLEVLDEAETILAELEEGSTSDSADTIEPSGKMARAERRGESLVERNRGTTDPGFDAEDGASVEPGAGHGLLASAAGPSSTQVADPSAGSPSRGSQNSQGSGSSGPGSSEPSPGSGKQTNPPGEGDRGLAGIVDVRPVVGEILVRFAELAEGTAIENVLREIDGEIDHCFDSTDYCLVKVPDAVDVLDLAEQLIGNPAVAGAAPNWVRAAAGQPKDTLFPLQWSLHDPLLDADIGALGAWNAMGSAGKAHVAILDTAVDSLHLDLHGVIAKTIRVGDDESLVGSLTDHGTNVAGVLAAKGDNFGISGVNREWASLVVFDVFSTIRLNSGRGSLDLVQVLGAKDSDIIAAIDQFSSKRLLDEGIRVRVANMSFSGGAPADALCDAIARNPNVLFVAAAGNNGSDSSNVYPANCPSRNVVAVASLGRTGRLAPSSNRGSWVEIAAPGEEILTTSPGASYVVNSGTSMAAPHVTGVASLLFAKYPTASADLVADILRGTADDVGKLGIGGGRLNACRALGGTGC